MVKPFQVVHGRHKKPITHPVRMTIKLSLEDAAIIGKWARAAGITEERAASKVIHDRLRTEPQATEDEKEQYWLHRLATGKQR